MNTGFFSIKELLLLFRCDNNFVSEISLKNIPYLLGLPIKIFIHELISGICLKIIQNVDRNVDKAEFAKGHWVMGYCEHGVHYTSLFLFKMFKILYKEKEF